MKTYKERVKELSKYSVLEVKRSHELLNEVQEVFNIDNQGFSNVNDFFKHITRRFVYIVQQKDKMIVLGCFYSEEDALKYCAGSDNLQVLKAPVI